MKKILNTLYLSTENTYLRKEGEAVVLHLKNGEKKKLPLTNLEGIVCMGHIGASPSVLAYCCKLGIVVNFLSVNGRFLYRIQGAIKNSNVILRKKQYNISIKEEQALVLVKATVQAKLLNSRLVLQRASHDYSDLAELLKEPIEELKQLVKRTDLANNINEARGIEGLAAKHYFGCFDHLVLKNKEVFTFKTRNRRPPTDPINALLSFGYTLLYHDCISALETVGLDSQVGFLHKDRAGRSSLALDLMEEFRSVLIDRLVLSCINLQIIKPQHFIFSQSGSIKITDEGRKSFITAYQAKKHDELTHPFLNEKMEMGLLPYIQALLMARYIRGEMDGYPSFIN